MSKNDKRASPEYEISKAYYKTDNKIKIELKKDDTSATGFSVRMNNSLKNIFSYLSAKNKEYTETLPSKGLQKQTYLTLSKHLKYASNELNNKISQTIDKYKESPTNLTKIKSELENDFKQNGVTQITYSNGSKQSLSNYISMSTRTLRCETDNIQSIKNAKDLGTDYVYLSPSSGHCPICDALGDRVYCISGKDSSYPKVYGDLFKNNYHTIHPNCRCIVQPYFMHLKTKEQLNRDKIQSNRSYNSSVENNRKYQGIQAYSRQLIQEEQEYRQMKATLGEDFIFANIGSFRRARRNKSSSYLDIRKTYNNKISNIKNSGQKSDNKPKTFPKDKRSSIIKEEATPKLEFVEAKTIKEANDFAREKLNIQHADYSGIHVDYANSWNRGLTQAFNDFPELRERIKYTGSAQTQVKLLFEHMVKVYTKLLSNDEKLLKLWDKTKYKTKEEFVEHAVRQYPKLKEIKKIKRKTLAISISETNKLYNGEYNGITINRNRAKDMENYIEIYNYNVSIKFHPKGTGGANVVKATIDHEIAHQIYDMIGGVEEIKRLFVSLTKEDIKEQLCTYGATNVDEFVAESWSEYCNNPIPRPLATKVAEIIKKEYQAWRKKKK